MSEEYTISGLLDLSIAEADVCDALLSTATDQGYKLYINNWKNKDSIDSIKMAKQSMLSGDSLWIENNKENSNFLARFAGPKELKSHGYKMLIITISNMLEHWGSAEYLDEIEAFTRDLCNQLPIPLLYVKVNPSKVGPNPEFIDSSVEDISSLCYFSDEVLEEPIRERILNSPVYSTTELSTGLYIRVAETLEAVSDKQEQIEDATELNVVA